MTFHIFDVCVFKSALSTYAKVQLTVSQPVVLKTRRKTHRNTDAVDFKLCPPIFSCSASKSDLVILVLLLNFLLCALDVCRNTNSTFTFTVSHNKKHHVIYKLVHTEFDHDNSGIFHWFPY